MPSLIKAALLKERTADKENNIDIKEIRRLYGEIRYENQIYSVKITVKVYKTEVSKAYSYEVIDMKNPADKRQGSFCPLSYIEDLTPPTDGKIPNPDFLSVAASLPAPEPRQPVAEKRSTDFFQSGQRKQYASSSTHSDISNGKDTTSFQIIKYKRPNFQKK